MASQFVMRDSVPSVFTTMGPRWSSLAVPWPEETSSSVVGESFTEGSARIFSGFEVEVDVEDVDVES